MNSFIKITVGILCFLTTPVFAANFTGDPWPDGVLEFRYSSHYPLSPQAQANFEEAINYFHDNTLLRLAEVSSNHRIFTIQSGHRNMATSLGRPDCRLWSLLCNASITLTDDVDVHTIIHELLHGFGFAHEHQRADRDDHIWFDYESLRADRPNMSNGDFYRNYDVKSEDGIIGPYDFHSTMHYNSVYFSVKSDDPQAVHDLIIEASDKPRGFRIVADSGVPEPFDGLTLHAQDLPQLSVDPVPTGWHSALWDFEYTGQGEYFHINNFWGRDYYLVESGGGIPTLTHKNSLNLSSNRAQWQVYVSGGKFYLKNRHSGQYLEAAAGTLSYSSTASPWMIHASIPYGRQHTLSPMDHLALHWAYGSIFGNAFRIQITDETPTIADNKSLHLPIRMADNTFGNIPVKVLPLLNGENWWSSAMWELERVGKYFRFRNFRTKEYLTNETGQLGMHAEDEINSLGDTLPSWNSAIWKLEPTRDSIRVKNLATGEYLFNDNGQLGLTFDPLPADSRWDFGPVDWDKFE